jgi:hypothetical protein
MKNKYPIVLMGSSWMSSPEKIRRSGISCEGVPGDPGIPRRCLRTVHLPAGIVFVVLLCCVLMCLLFELCLFSCCVGCVYALVLFCFFLFFSRTMNAFASAAILC